MSKRLKMLTVSLFLACIMIVSFAGVAFAGDGHGSSALCDGDSIPDHDQHQFGQQDN